MASKIALAHSQPLTFAAMRGVFSALCLFLVLIVTRRSLRPPPLGYTTVIGLLQTTAFMGLVTVALYYAGAGKVAVLTYTMPFWLLLLAWAFLSERIHGVQWLAVALSFVGLMLVVAPWQIDGMASSLLTVAGGFAWAASAVVIKLLQRCHHVDILSLTAWQMAIGSLPLVAIAVLTYGGGPDWTADFVLGLAYNVVLANTLAWLLWLYALRTLSAGAAGLGTLAIPVVGVLSAWLQLGEQPSAVEAVGMALIVGALAILAARGLAAGRHQPTPVAEEPFVRPVTD